MKIVKFQGGIGNQMFQYAFLLALQVKFQEEILADTTSYCYDKQRHYELGKVFDIYLKFATKSDLKKITYYNSIHLFHRVIKKISPLKKSEFFEKVSFSYDESVFNNVDRYYAGFWMNTFYFKSIEQKIREAYKFNRLLDTRNQQTLNKIKGNESVSIHVRRTDYVSLGYHLVSDLDYYQSAIEYIKGKKKAVTFYIFSDDILWCKANLPSLIRDSEYIFVDWNTNDDNHYIDLQLMMSCKHNILANSTFSWWGAWLNNNPDKIVTAAKGWVEQCKFEKGFILPDWKVL